MTAPLAIDLFCGLGGWSEGLLAEGWNVVGFDVERHSYPVHSLPERPEAEKSSAFDSSSDAAGHNQRINRMRDALKGKEVIGWQEYPAQLVIQDVLTIHGRQFRDADLIVASPPCQEYSYMAMPWSRAKAIAADYESGVRDKANLTALFDACFRIQREACEASGRYIPLVVENVRGAQKWVGRSRYHFGSFHLWGDVPALMPVVRARALKMPEGDGVRSDKSRSAALANYDQLRKSLAVTEDGIKQGGISGPRANGKGDAWFQDGAAKAGSKSAARKSASAQIAKIPLVLSRHIAKAWHPEVNA